MVSLDNMHTLYIELYKSKYLSDQYIPTFIIIGKGSSGKSSSLNCILYHLLKAPYKLFPEGNGKITKCPIFISLIPSDNYNIIIMYKTKILAISNDFNDVNKMYECIEDFMKTVQDLTPLFINIEGNFKFPIRFCDIPGFNNNKEFTNQLKTFISGFDKNTTKIINCDPVTDDPQNIEKIYDYDVTFLTKADLIVSNLEFLTYAKKSLENKNTYLIYNSIDDSLLTEIFPECKDNIGYSNVIKYITLEYNKMCINSFEFVKKNLIQKKNNIHQQIILLKDEYEEKKEVLIFIFNIYSIELIKILKNKEYDNLNLTLDDNITNIYKIFNNEVKDLYAKKYKLYKEEFTTHLKYANMLHSIKSYYTNYIQDYDKIRSNQYNILIDNIIAEYKDYLINLNENQLKKYYNAMKQSTYYTDNKSKLLCSMIEINKIYKLLHNIPIIID